LIPEAPIDLSHIKDVQPQEVLSFCKKSYSRVDFKQLRLGNMHIDARIDLHHCTLKQAVNNLTHWFNEHAGTHLCGLIIHGKGQNSPNQKPLLKSWVNHWLRSQQQVLAFHSAIPKHGGAGAVYVVIGASVRFA